MAVHWEPQKVHLSEQHLVDNLVDCLVQKTVKSLGQQWVGQMAY